MNADFSTSWDNWVYKDVLKIDYEDWYFYEPYEL
jgi:hypothetical protein